MARPRVLDQGIMLKIAKKTGKDGLAPVNSMVSRRAAKFGISCEAALVILAREHGIGTSIYQRGLEATKQAEIRAALPSAPPFINGNSQRARVVRVAAMGTGKKAARKAAIEDLIQDSELKDRCCDILLASANFDRPVNQATLVLEDRIRKKAQPPQGLVGANLVGYAFNEDLSTTVLRVAGGDPDDQRGFTQIMRGIVPAFRNKTHHHIINNFSRQEALRVCGFIDVLLRVVDQSVKIK